MTNDLHVQFIAVFALTLMLVVGSFLYVYHKRTKHEFVDKETNL